MLRFGRYYNPPNRWGKEEEEEWRQLLRDTMRDLNGRAFIADCKKGDRTPDQPPHDYYSFDPDDRDLAMRSRAGARCRISSAPPSLWSNHE